MKKSYAKAVLGLAMTWLLLAQAAVPLRSQADLDKSPIIFTGTVTSRETSQWSVEYCTVVTLTTSKQDTSRNAGRLSVSSFDNTNAGIRCLLERTVTLTLLVKDTNAQKQVHGVNEIWVTNTPNPPLASKVPIPPEPVGGNGGTPGIGAQVGDVLKIYENNNGQLEFDGIQLIGRARP